jgi:protein gp37
MKEEWVVKIKEQCLRAGVPFFKQLVQLFSIRWRME